MSVACVNIEDSFILNYLLWAGSNNKHIGIPTCFGIILLKKKTIR